MIPVTIVHVDGYVIETYTDGGAKIYIRDSGDELFIPSAPDLNEDDPVTVTITVERKDATK